VFLQQVSLMYPSRMYPYEFFPPMKQTVFTFLLSLVVLLGLKPDQAYSKTPFLPETVRIGYQGTYMYYDEYEVMYEEGFLNGIFMDWTAYSAEEAWMVSVEAEASTGKLHYVGGYIGGQSVEGNTEDYLLGVRALVGRGMHSGDLLLTPYSGIGFRYWNDRIGVPGGYTREISQAYIPFGLRIDQPFGQVWRYGCAAELDILAFGTVQSHLSQVSSSYIDAYNVQGFAKGIGGRVSFYAERAMDDYVIGVEPFFRYWQFDNSRKDSMMIGGTRRYLHEPNNEFFISGIRAYMRF
jgi:hypothetical protein